MTDSRSISVRDSVISRFKLLESALSGGSLELLETLAAACKSQAAFASLDLPDKGVGRLSLNTLKSVADITIEEGGWRRIDEMRRQFHKAQSTNARPKAQVATPTGDPLALERRLRLRLEAAYIELLQKLIKLSDTIPELDEFISRHQAGFSLTRLQLISGGDDGN